MQEHTVFVYGTLMRKESNHHWLGDATFIGECTLSGFDLYDLGSYPAIVPGSSRVFGECYQVTPAVLHSLDDLEDHPHLYERQQHFLDNGCLAWVYVGKPKFVLGMRQIKSGSWRVSSG